MAEQEKSKPLLSGILYGEFAFWVAIIGMAVAVVGIGMYFFGVSRLFSCQLLLNELLAGENPEAIWKDVVHKEIERGHWYLRSCSSSDAICMIGIGICGLAGIVGMLGSIAGMVIGREKPRIFLVFAIIIAVILVLSATGLISIH